MKQRVYLIDDMELFLLDRLQGSKPLLEVGPDGVIKYAGKVLKHVIDPQGYPRVYWIENFIRKSAFVHRLIAKEFIENPEDKPYVNHINGNKCDYSIHNLEWVTPVENTTHAINSLEASSHPGRPVTTKERNEKIQADFKGGMSRELLVKKWNLKRHTINLALRENVN